MSKVLAFGPRPLETLEGRRVPSQGSIGAAVGLGIPSISAYHAARVSSTGPTSTTVKVAPVHANTPASHPVVAPHGTPTPAAGLRAARPALLHARAITSGVSALTPTTDTVRNAVPVRINVPSYRVSPGLGAGSSNVGNFALGVTGITTSPFATPDAGLINGFTTSPYVSPTTGDFVPFTTSPYVTPFGAGGSTASTAL